MKYSKILSFALTIFSFISCNAQTTSQNSSLNLITSIPLPNVSGRIDHLTFDSKNKIVFVAALGNNTVEVVDLKSNKVIHTIRNLNEPQGLAFIPESNSLVIANGSNGACDVFNTTTFQKTTSINLGDDADNVRYNAADKKIYVGYGSGGIAIIDATTFKILSQIKLSGHPESFQLDKSANKIYVNVPDAHQIAVIDLTKNVVVDKWIMTEAKSNFPMALDETNHRLFIGCRHPSKLLVIDTQTGKTISSLDIDSDTDDVFYSSTNKENLPDGSQVYVSCGGGYIDMFTQTDANTYKANGKIETKPGARTSLFIPELNQLIVASPSAFTRQAELLIYNTKFK